MYRVQTHERAKEEGRGDKATSQPCTQHMKKNQKCAYEHWDRR